MTPRICDGSLSVDPVICKAHEMVDSLGLASSQLFTKVPPDETISKSVDSSFGQNILQCVTQAEPPRYV
jgi:hypothetical protein